MAVQRIKNCLQIGEALVENCLIVPRVFWKRARCTGWFPKRVGLLKTMNAKINPVVWRPIHLQVSITFKLSTNRIARKIPWLPQR